MTGEQMALNDSEVLRSAARMLDSLADELLDASRGHEDREAAFSYKSAATLSLVGTTLRSWATDLEQPDLVSRLLKNEEVLRMVKPLA